jgi:predicted ATPase/DNA-binding SARP family transcriptional activator
MEMLEVRLIGTFAIECDGRPVTISSRVAQSLFAYLILNAGTSYRREKLAGMFWPDATEEKARAYLRYELWRIRKAIPSSDLVISNNFGIIFDSSTAYWLDVQVLEKLIEVTSADELMAALSNYKGELLPGFYDEWVVLEREHLQAVYEQKIARLLDSLESEKRWSEILDWAEHWISFGQAPEAAYRYLMIAYDALGDHVKVASTYECCVHALRELDLEPSEQTRALAFKRTSKLNVPIPLTSFIGREKELKEVTNLLSKSRLVTLTGSGGVGKTRLAIQVVADVLELFPHGVWFLDLAPLSDPTLVSNTLASLLGLRESRDTKLSVTDLLINYLHSRTALIIFDNCEHLIESCAQLVNLLLISCENLTILATSREALRVSGEIPYRVPSLEIPRLDIESAIDVLAKIESVRLFNERAGVALSRFAMGPQNALVIAQICRRLDGIPLAIELAAARTNMLAVEQILRRLDDRFRLLTGGLRSALPRHQTLRATIEWSYDLLSEKERILFRRLAVFMGGWTLEAAEEVCTGDGIESADILDLLSQLVSKSLIVVEFLNNGETRDPAAGSLRYRRLETIRQFGREKLFETAEAAHLQDRHLAYFLKFAEEIEPYLTGPEQPTWLDHLDLELDNIRLALEWSISNKRGEESLRLFSALGWFWYIRCHLEEGRKWFRRSLQVRDGTSKSAQANTFLHASRLYWALEDFASAKTILRESLDLYRELGNMNDISHGLVLMGVIELSQGDLTEARKLFEEGLSVSRRVNDKPTMARALSQLGTFSRMEGDYVTAWQHHEESLAICRQIQDSHLTIVVLQSMGEFALEQKDNLKAREYYEETLAICRHLKNKRATAYSILGFAGILCAEAQYTQSARLQGFAETLFSESESLTEASFAQIRKAGDILKTYLGEDSYQKEFDIGKALKCERAVEIALKEQA